MREDFFNASDSAECWWTTECMKRIRELRKHAICAFAVGIYLCFFFTIFRVYYAYCALCFILKKRKASQWERGKSEWRKTRKFVACFVCIVLREWKILFSLGKLLLFNSFFGCVWRDEKTSMIVKIVLFSIHIFFRLSSIFMNWELICVCEEKLNVWKKWNLIQTHNIGEGQMSKYQSFWHFYNLF
jgi:hypothetical protein